MKTSLAYVCVSAILIPQASLAATVTFYSNQSTFAAAVNSALTNLDFEGIVGDNQSHFYGSSTSVGGVTFASTPLGIPLPPAISVVGKNAAYAASAFPSAFLSEGNRNGIIATLPAGKVAVGANVGDIYQPSTTTFPNSLMLSLVGTGGVLDTRTISLSGLANGTSPLQFVGYIVSGDTIVNLTFNPVGSSASDGIGIDNLQFADAASTPEPASLLLMAAGLAVLTKARRLTNTPRAID